MTTFLGYGQNKSLKLSTNDKLEHSLTSAEFNKVENNTRDFLSTYEQLGSLIDPMQQRITRLSIQRFEALHDANANILARFIKPNQVTNVSHYITLARTYFEKEGVPFKLSNAELVSIELSEECSCFISTVHVDQSIMHHYQNERWIYEPENERLELVIEIDEETFEAKLTSMRLAPKIEISQKKQHFLSVLGGTSIFSGNINNDFEMTSPYTVGVSYHYIHPLKFLGNSISLVAGAQLKYSSLKTTALAGGKIVLSQNDVLNSITEVEFLTQGEEQVNTLWWEPQLGFDVQFMETTKKQMGLMFLFSPRYSISSSASFQGALSYSETFNDRVTVTDVINCGLRDFEGANAVNAEYETNLYRAGLGFSISPYYQFQSGENSAFRISLDVNYYLSNIFSEEDKFLGNYNDANNPDTNDNPAFDPGGTLAQTVGGDLSELYFGLRISYGLSK